MVTDYDGEEPPLGIEAAWLVSRSSSAGKDRTNSGPEIDGVALPASPSHKQMSTENRAQSKKSNMTDRTGAPPRGTATATGAGAPRINTMDKGGRRPYRGKGRGRGRGRGKGRWRTQERRMRREEPTEPEGYRRVAARRAARQIPQAEIDADRKKEQAASAAAVRNSFSALDSGDESTEEEAPEKPQLVRTAGISWAARLGGTATRTARSWASDSDSDSG